MIIRTLCASALAMLFAGAAHAESCGLAMYQSLPLSDTPGGHIAVSVPIKDAPVALLVDTAGFMSTLTPETVKQLDLSTRSVGQTAAFGVNGEKFNQIVKVPTIKFGILAYRDSNFLLDATGWLGDHDKVGGTLGPDVLSTFDVDFDFGAGKMNLFSQDHCEGQVVYWTKQPVVKMPFTLNSSGAIEVEMQLDGKDVTAVLDTGAPTSVIPDGMASKLFDISAKSAGAEPLGGNTTAFRYKFKSLGFSGLQITNPLIVVIEDRIHKAAMQEALSSYTGDRMNLPHSDRMILGLATLRKLHLYIAYKEKALYLSAADAH